MTVGEPSAKSRQIAFDILTRHPPCLADDVPMSDLIDDIATAIDRASGETVETAKEKK